VEKDARAAIQAAPYLPATESTAARATAERILCALDIDDLSYMNEPDRFAPEHRFLTRFFSGDAMANWLWAYWLGREGKVYFARHLLAAYRLPECLHIPLRRREKRSQ